MQNRGTQTAEDWDAPSWNLWQGIFLLIMYLLLSYFLQFLLGKPDSSPEVWSDEAVMTFMLIQCGKFVLGMGLVWGGLALVKGSWEQLGAGRCRRCYLLMGLAAGVGLAVLVTAAALLQDRLLDGILGLPAPQGIERALMGVHSSWQMAVLVLCAVVLIPLVEELLFRGVLYPPMRNLWGAKVAVGLVALLFAAFHGDGFRFLPLFLGALGLTLLREKTRSLWPCVAAHGVWNLMMVVWVMWQGGGGNA